MKNKHVKQMMFDVGALDTKKLLEMYIHNATKSCLGKKGLSYNNTSFGKLSVVATNVLNGCYKRGWIKKPSIKDNTFHVELKPNIHMIDINGVLVYD